MPAQQLSPAYRIALPFGILITVEPSGAASLESDLRRELLDETDPSADSIGLAAVDAIESLLLALVAAGVDLSGQAAHAAIVTAVEQIATHV